MKSWKNYFNALIGCQIRFIGIICKYMFRLPDVSFPDDFDPVDYRQKKDGGDL